MQNQIDIRRLHNLCLNESDDRSCRHLTEQEEYWTNMFVNEVLFLDLPTDYTRHGLRHTEFASVKFLIDRATREQLSAFDREAQDALLVAAYYILLWKYTGKEDIVIGLPVTVKSAHGTHEETTTNILALRNYPMGNEYTDQFVIKVKDSLNQAFENKDFAIEQLVEKVKKIQRSDKFPLFETAIILPCFKENQQELRLKDLGDISEVDILCKVELSNDDFCWELEFNTNLFTKETITTMAAHLTNVVKTLIRSPNKQLKDVEILSDIEKRIILYDYNNTKTEFDRNKTIQELFEDQVEKQLDKIAVTFKQTHLTYKELNEKSNQLAHLLKEKGVSAGTCVGIIMNRSIEMIIGVIAVLKAGGAYVPVEVYYPMSRIQRMLTKVNTRYIITKKAHLDLIADLQLRQTSLEFIFCLDSLDDKDLTVLNDTQVYDISQLKHCSVDNLNTKPSANDVAYVIFTSGSSGEPKGVVAKHSSVVNLITWFNKTFDITSSDRILFITSLCFDLSVYDIFGILAAGGSILVASYDDIRSPRLLNILYSEEITLWDSAPAALQQLVPFFPINVAKGKNSMLRFVFLSGDWIPVALPDIITKTFTSAKVVSLGGATEATIWSNYYLINCVNPRWKSIPYGKPIQNSQYYIVDNYLNLCPIGVPGDLYIGGDCVTLGYINDQVLTDEKFIQNPFVQEHKDIIYRTGDIAKWCRDGNIELIGRKDFQVKIKGYRIELGEIENLLRKHSLVKDAIVIARDDNGEIKYLCAYIVSEEEIKESEIRLYLSGELPEYMIPSYFVRMQALPVTSNGKVDRKYLPKPS